jgi:hypothetical protein
VVGFDRIVRLEDKEQFIRIPVGTAERSLDAISGYSSTLQDIGVSVSTGPIVDFRMKEHLQMEPLPGSVPLLYPGHFIDGKVVWPRPNFKKPNCRKWRNAPLAIASRLLRRSETLFVEGRKASNSGNID